MAVQRHWFENGRCLEGTVKLSTKPSPEWGREADNYVKVVRQR